MSDINNNIQYIDDNNIKFTEVKLPETLFTSGPLGIKGRIKKDGVLASLVVDNDKSPLINAVDIDWNGVDVGEEVLRTTGDLISWIKTKGSGGSGSGVSLNAGLTAINSSGLLKAYQAGLVLMYNGITYTWGIPSTSLQQLSINYLWAYTVAENDNAARNKLNRALTKDVPDNYSNVPLTPPEGQFLYMTTARKLGNTYLRWDGTNVWSLPIRIGDNSTSGTGTDGDSYNYIYCLTDKNTTPIIPPSLNVLVIEDLPEDYGINLNGLRDNSRVNVWRDHPNGVDKDFPLEWIAVAKSEDGTWGGYSTPALWSHYGIDGKDGDTIEYIYKLTSSNIDSVTIDYPYLYEKNGIIHSTEITGEEYLKDDFIPREWSDNPLSLTTLQNRLWVSTRRGEWNDSQNKIVWGKFSAPTIWSESSVIETVIDAPYIITNDNPWMVVRCAYDGTILDSGNYGRTGITIRKGNEVVTDLFDWTYSVTEGLISVLEDNPKIRNNCYHIYPNSISSSQEVDKAVITITGTLLDISLSTTVTVIKIKASSPGEIPTVYSLLLSLDVAIRNANNEIINNITINARKNTEARIFNPLVDLTDPLRIFVLKGEDTNTRIEIGTIPFNNDNTLLGSELTNFFGNNANVGDVIKIFLTKSDDVTFIWDIGYITLISGEVIVNVDGYTFALEKNYETITYENNTFNPLNIKYKILGWKNRESLTMTDYWQNGTRIYISPASSTNCNAEIGIEDNFLYVKMFPISTTSGGLVNIICLTEENEICQVLEAMYLLETSSYKIKVLGETLTAEAESRVRGIESLDEKYSALITHNSRTLNSTIEALNVFPNLFGFSNGLSFYDSEPFIQGYGLEVRTALFTGRNFSSGVYYFNFDSSKSVIASMNVYIGYNIEYFLGAILHGNYPSKIECNGEERPFDEGYTIRLLGGTTYKIKFYFDDISVVYDGNFRNALGFHVSIPSASTSEEISRRLYVQNLKVEYGSIATKFCISDEDAALKNLANLVTEDFICSEGSENTSPYQLAIYNSHSTAAVDGYPNVHCFTNFEINSNSYGDAWLLLYSRDFNLMSNINKVYTFSFLAKTNIKTTNIENILYINPGASSNPRIGDYTYYNYNEALFNESNGRKVHSLDTEWKRYYTHFYISNSASGLTFLPVIKVVNDNSHSNIDYDGNGNIKTRTVYITDLMLQEGYISSEELSFSDKFHTTSQINLTASSITLSVNDQINNLSSLIELTSNDINLCVKKNDLVQSGITLNADGVIFTAEKVSFQGTNNKDYIRLGRYSNGLPYFYFLDPNGNITYSLGYQGLLSYMNNREPNMNTMDSVRIFTGNNFDGIVGALIMYNILSNINDPTGYTELVNYYRFNSKISNGEMSTAGRKVDGMLFSSNETFTYTNSYYQEYNPNKNGPGEGGYDIYTPFENETLPKLVNNYPQFFATSDVWWSVEELTPVSSNTIYRGMMYIYKEGIKYFVGPVSVLYSGGNYKYFIGESESLYELLNEDETVLDLSNPLLVLANL